MHQASNPPAPTPNPNDAAPAARVITEAIADPLDGAGGTADPMQLFASTFADDYDANLANGGRLTTLQPSPTRPTAAAASGDKRHMSSPRRAVQPGAGKKQVTSPARRAVAAIANTAASIARPPPIVRTDDPSPTSILDSIVAGRQLPARNVPALAQAAASRPPNDDGTKMLLLYVPSLLVAGRRSLR